MAYFLEDLRMQLITDLTYLKTTYPNTYLYSTDLLSSVFIDYEPTDGSDYIVLKDIGEELSNVFGTYKYSVNTKLVINNSENVGVNTISYMGKGIGDRLYLMINKSLTNFKIVNVIKYSYKPIRLNDRQWQCEVICDFFVDTLTIDGDITQEFFEES